LKKQLLRDYIRVIARAKTGYFLRYFNFHNEEEGEAGAAFCCRDSNVVRAQVDI